jgi:hypothetical protein
MTSLKGADVTCFKTKRFCQPDGAIRIKVQQGASHVQTSYPDPRFETPQKYVFAFPVAMLWGPEFLCESRRLTLLSRGNSIC